MFSVKKGTSKHCCYGICRSDSRRKSFSECLYYFISFPKPCLEYRRKLIKTTKKKHIKMCSKCAKCNLWVKRCGRGDGRFQLIDHVTKDTYICSLHFEGESGPTTEHPDPISCVENSQVKVAKKARTCLAEKYEQTHGDMNQGIEYLNYPADHIKCEEDDQNLIIDDEHDAATSASALSHHAIETPKFISFFIINDGHNAATSASALSYDAYQTPEFVSCNEDNTSAFACITRNQDVQTDLKKFTSKRTQVNLRQISVMDNFEDSIKTNPKKCKFYTSLEYQEIVILHDFVNPKCKNVTDEIGQPGENDKSNNNQQKLTSVQQLILVLIRLRVGTLIEDLAYRFEISVGLVSKTIKTWIQFLYNQFTFDLKPFMCPTKVQSLPFIKNWIHRIVVTKGVVMHSVSD